MLEVQVINDVREVPEVKPGQVRKREDFDYYALIVCDGEGGFNAIKLTDGEGSYTPNFETVFTGWVSKKTVKETFPIVVDAKLTIVDKEER
jgi:hypothetical protein